MMGSIGAGAQTMPLGTKMSAYRDFCLMVNKAFRECDTELLSKGDLFLFTIMNQTLVYQVERISAAPANQTFILERTISKDLMTIVSATRDGGIRKRGTGTLLLWEANTFTGPS